PAGVLQITGDHGDNQFTIAPSPISGMIRITGNPDTQTTINGQAFVDFSVSDVTDIAMTLLDGLDNVTLRDLNISGNLTINYANAADVIMLPNFNANATNFVYSGTGAIPGSGINGGLVGPNG